MPVNGERFGEGGEFGAAIAAKRAAQSHASESLELPGTVLLVNVAESLALLAVLHQAGCRQDETDVDADHAEDGREDVVDESVGKGRQGRGASSHKRGGGGTRAGSVGDEGRRRAVEVATALELRHVSGAEKGTAPGLPAGVAYRGLQQLLHLGRLRCPNVGKLLLRL